MRIDIAQLEFITPLLREMALDLEKHFGVEFIITSLYRINDTGVHGQLPLRGIDLSCKDEAMGLIVENYINKKWCYDPQRLQMMCCMYHAVVGGAFHIHLQVHPNTVANNED